MGKRRKRKKHQGPTRKKENYWTEPTNPGGYTYYFHPKHRGNGSPHDSRWKLEVTLREEFGIFESAVGLDLSDESGHLYNVRKDVGGSILELGVFHEQIARFWKPRGDHAWHGHPLWPVWAGRPSNRANQIYRPSRVVFRKFVEQGVLSESQGHRLNSGKNV